MIEISHEGHNLWAVTRNGKFAAALRWHGEHMKLVDPEGEDLGDLYRSDGKIQSDGSITYTWRAYLPGPSGRCVARRVPQADAIAAIFDAN